MLALAVPRPSPFPHLPLAHFPSPPWRCVTYNEKHINQIDVLGIDWENPTRQSYVLFETLPSAGSYASGLAIKNPPKKTRPIKPKKTRLKKPKKTHLEVGFIGFFKPTYIFCSKITFFM
jgi:hypothetical protein